MTAMFYLCEDFSDGDFFLFFFSLRSCCYSLVIFHIALDSILRYLAIFKHSGKKELVYCWWECKMAEPPLKTFWWFLTKLNNLTLCNRLNVKSLTPNSCSRGDGIRRVKTLCRD